VEFVWDLYPFKLFCWDLALLLDVIFCPICWFIWVPFQCMAVPFNIFFIAFLPCNMVGVIFNVITVLLFLPPGIIVTIYNKGCDGILLATAVSLFIATPGVFAGLFLWDSVIKSLYTTYCSVGLGYVGLSAYCDTLSTILTRAASLLSTLITALTGG
jgi:hypothetical protein